MDKSNVVGLDLGRRNIKLFTGETYVTIPSIVGEWRDILLENNYGPKAFKCKYKGDKFFAGVLAENESEFARQMLVEDKSTPDALLLALIALHQTEYNLFDIMTGLPVSQHNKENKERLINLLEGEHEIEVNGVKKQITVQRVRVAVEGGGAFWSNPKDGLVRIVDGGSKTINYITLKNKRYVDRDSGTLPFGFDTNKTYNHEQMVNRIAGELGRKWGRDDFVYTVGGEAETLAKYLKPYFNNTDVLQPKRTLLKGGELVDLNMFANAEGYYAIGRSV